MMKKFLLLASVALCGLLHADVVANQEVIAATNVVRSFVAANNFGTDERYLTSAKAVAILTDVKRLAAGASLQYGDGIFSVKGENGEWSSPIFIKYKGYGVGLQAGYETSDIVMIFHTTKSYQDIFTGTDTLEINVGAAAGGVGRRTGRATDLPDISAWMVSPGEQTGVYLGVSIDNGRITIDDQLTNDFYERIYDYEDILNDSPRANKYAKRWKEVMRKYFTNGEKYGANSSAAIPVNHVQKKYPDGKPIISNRSPRTHAKATRSKKVKKAK